MNRKRLGWKNSLQILEFPEIVFVGVATNGRGDGRVEKVHCKVMIAFAIASNAQLEQTHGRQQQPVRKEKGG
jgi:hypothetical protein